jgi:hypothetical protein
MNYQHRPPAGKPYKLSSDHIAILCDDEFEVRMYSSLFRILERAPIEKKLNVFCLAAKFASEQIEARRQQVVDDLWDTADKAGLIRLLGKRDVFAALATEFGAADDSP